MDDDLRSLERAWERTPHDLAACDAYARAARRAGRVVPLAVLEARRFPARRLDLDAPVDVSAEVEDGWQVSLGMPSRGPGAGLDVPSCREWWIEPEGLPFKHLVELTRQVGAPHLEALSWAKRVRLDLPALRSFCVQGSLTARAWEQLAELPLLERVVAHHLPLRPGSPWPASLVGLGTWRLDDAHLAALSQGPPLRALSAERAALPLRDLAASPALRDLESLAYGGRSRNESPELGLVARWPRLRRLKLSRSPRPPWAALAGALRDLSALESLHVRSCVDLGDPELRALAAARPLRTLRLNHAQAISDLACLSELPELRQLDLSALVRPRELFGPPDDRLCDGGLARFTAPRLESLGLVGFAGVTGVGLEPSSFPALRRLFLPVSSVEAARRVAALPRLERLDTRGRPTTPGMLDALAGCQALRATNLYLPAGAAGLVPFLEAVPLEELTLAVDVLTDDVVAALGRARSLRRLDLMDRSTEAIERVELAPLGELPALEDLTLHAYASPTSWQALARAPRLRVIRWSSARHGHPLVGARCELDHVHVIGGRGAWRKRREWFA